MLQDAGQRKDARRTTFLLCRASGDNLDSAGSTFFSVASLVSFAFLGLILVTLAPADLGVGAAAPLDVFGVDDKVSLILGFLTESGR